MIVSFPYSYSLQLHSNRQVVNGELNQQSLWPQSGLFPLSPSFLFPGFNHSNGFKLGSNKVSHAPQPVLEHLKLFIRIRSCSQTKRGVNVEEHRSLNGTDRTQQLSISSRSRVAIMMSRAAACKNFVCKSIVMLFQPFQKSGRTHLYQSLLWFVWTLWEVRSHVV